MSNIYDTHHTDLSIHGELRVTGFLSLLRTKQDPEPSLIGHWKLVMRTPMWSAYGLHIFLHTPPDASTLYPDLPAIVITTRFLRLESDDMVAGPFVLRWKFPLDDPDSSHTLLCPSSITWDALLHKIRPDDGFRITVDIKSAPVISPSSRSIIADNVILRNLAYSLDGLDFSDTKFLVFSRRRQVNGETVSGARDPLPVYASSALLKPQCEYFKDILGDINFMEGKSVSFSDPIPDSDTWTESCEYESDSDLGYFSDDEDTDADNHVEYKKPTPSHLGIGKVVQIRDTAYVTWKALMFYMYTSQITFAPLSSSHLIRRRSAEQRQYGHPSKPSAKSMYRLADKIGLDDLRQAALVHIVKELTPENIVSELFSDFTWRYQPVCDIELAFASKHWGEIKKSAALGAAIVEVAQGLHPHSAGILKVLLGQ